MFEAPLTCPRCGAVKHPNDKNKYMCGAYYYYAAGYMKLAYPKGCVDERKTDI